MAERERSLSERIMDAITHGFGRQRYLQSSPILPDVWDAYVQPIVERIESGQQPPPSGFAPIRVDLLLSTSDGSEPGAIAAALRRGIAMLHPDASGMEPEEVRKARIARNRSTVAANLTFEDLVCIAIPLTHWWQ